MHIYIIIAGLHVDNIMLHIYMIYDMGKMHNVAGLHIEMHDRDVAGLHIEKVLAGLHDRNVAGLHIEKIIAGLHYRYRYAGLRLKMPTAYQQY